MPLRITTINMPPGAPAVQDKATMLQVTPGRTANAKPMPLLRMFKDDGSYHRFLVELVVADTSSGMILRGGAQLVIAEKRIGGLMVNGELTNAATKQKRKLSQDTGQMACFSVNCDELGLVAVPTNRRGKPTAIHLGTDINKGGGFAVKVTAAFGFLNSDGAAGRATIEQVAAALEKSALTVSRGVSIY
jgi:hypothetical protein